MPRIFLLACFTALLFVAPLPAQPVSAKHARVELLSQPSAVASGQYLDLGVHFTLEQGWHIYWINPGDSGQPPAFQWQLPPGFTAGEIEWPLPRKLQSSPTLADYGYSDDVLLIIPVRVPADKSQARRLDLGVHAKWLICREVCIPDHAELKLNVPEGRAGTNPQTAALFAKAKSKFPSHGQNHGSPRLNRLKKPSCLRSSQVSRSAEQSSIRWIKVKLKTRPCSG